MISVIVPFYKTEKEKFDLCIKSILVQNFQEYELLIVDDGSGDDYKTVLENVGQLDGRIRIIRKEKNGGLSAARNQGLLLAKGQYVVFVDGDDLINCRALQNMYQSLLQTNSDMVIGGLRTIRSYEEACYWNGMIPKEETMDGLTALERLLTNDGFGSTACCRLASKKIWLQNGAPFKEGIYHEDLASMWKVVDACKKICFLEGEYYYYYQGGDSSIHNGNHLLKFTMDFFQALHDRNQFLLETRPTLQNAIQYSYLFYVPVIYVFAKELDEKDAAIKRLKRELLGLYKNAYPSGSRQAFLTGKQKWKFRMFLWFPELYVILYKMSRRRKGYRL